MTGEIPQQQVPADAGLFPEANLPGEEIYLGPPSSGKTSAADQFRAQLAAEGAPFREKTVMRGGREVIEFHVERPEAGR